MKYTKYVTEYDQYGTPLMDPHYEEVRMKIKEKDIPRCLTKAYFSELRREMKEKGAEHYSIAMRLFVAYNITTRSFKSLDYDQVLVHNRRLRAPVSLQLFYCQICNKFNVQNSYFKTWVICRCC